MVLQGVFTLSLELTRNFSPLHSISEAAIGTATENTARRTPARLLTDPLEFPRPNRHPATSFPLALSCHPPSLTLSSSFPPHPPTPYPYPLSTGLLFLTIPENQDGQFEIFEFETFRENANYYII